MDDLNLTAQNIPLSAHVGDDIEFELEFELAAGMPDIVGETDSILIEIFTKSCESIEIEATIVEPNVAAVHIPRVTTTSVGSGRHQWRVFYVYGDDGERRRCLIHGLFTLYSI